MTKHNICPNCGEKEFYHNHKYWWYGYYLTHYSCDECNYYATEINRKLIPEFLHKLIFYIASTIKHTFWKINDRFCYWKDLITRLYSNTSHRNFWLNL
ncbi:MAG: hypothetical protein AAGJ08_01815 [Cyanobacteria bacterium P01_H01_bin.35]